MTHNRQKGWKIIKNLANDPISPTQVAHQLLKTRSTMSNKSKRPVLSPNAEESMVSPFSEEEYRRGIATLKNNKAARIDGVLVKPLNDTVYKWWICHSKLCQIFPPPAMETRVTVFWAGRPCGPTGWLVLLLTKAGGVETNTGTLNKQVWICDICHKQIHVRKQISIRCNRIEHWVHFRCTDTWTCHPHRESRLTSHRHNNKPPLTNNNQPKDKNIVILHININGIRNL